MSDSLAADAERLINRHGADLGAWHCRHFRCCQLNVRRWQCASLLGGLTLIELAIGTIVPLEAAIGPSAALLTLVALWAAFGAERIALRLPMTLWLATADCVALLYGEWRANGIDEPAFLYLGAWLSAFGLMQLPLWLLRTVGGWRLEVMPAAYLAELCRSRRRAPPRSRRGPLVGRAVLAAINR